MSGHIYVNMNSNKLVDSEGIIYIGFTGKGDKTNPDMLAEWFNSDFLTLHKVYAIKEEEAFLLKIYTRTRELTNKVIRKKGGRKLMLLGEEVYGDIMVACGRCGYYSFEGSNVRRHLKKFVCTKERGYSKKEVDGLNRVERQKFIRRVAAAKFRAKRKMEEIEHIGDESENHSQDTDKSQIRICGQNISNSNLEFSDEPIRNNEKEIDNSKGIPCDDSHLISCNCIKIVSNLQNKCHRRKPYVARALTLGPLQEKEYVKKIPFDVYTLIENNIRVAWKPPSCHKAVQGEKCQIVFKGARMKRRCLDLPLPLILTYRKLDCKLHHCNFTLFHPHCRKIYNKEQNVFTSVIVRMYGDTVMTQEFCHYFVSLLSVMKMKASQTARHLTRVWETILLERLLKDTVPEEYRKIITLSKQTVKCLWSSIEVDSGKSSPIQLPKTSKRKRRPPVDGIPTEKLIQDRVPTEQLTFVSKPCPDTTSLQGISHEYQHSQLAPQLHISSQIQSEFNQHQECMKRFAQVMPKPVTINNPSVHSLPLSHPSSHPHVMLQGLHPPQNAPGPHWFGQPHHPPQQYPPPPMTYTIPPAVPPEEYYVQTAFVTQYTASNSIDSSP